MVIRFLSRLKNQWKLFEKLPAFPRNWKISLKFIFPFLFVLSLLMWIPAHYQRVSAERVFDGIAIPDSNRDISLSFNFSNQPASNDYFIKIPYKIENDGYYPIKDIQIEMSIYLEFTNKDGTEHDKTIFSKEKTVEKVNPGKKVEEYFDYNYLDKGWEGENIYYVMQNINPSEYVETYMELTITFSLAGHSGYTIIYEDIDLTEDTDTKVPNESSSTSATTKTPETAKNEITLANLMVMMAYMSVVMAILHFRRKGIKHQDTHVILGTQSRLFRVKFNVKNFLAKSRTKLFLRQLTFLSLFTVIPIYLYMNSLYQQKSQVIEEVSTGDYMQNYELATWISVVLLSIIYLMTLLPSIKPKSLKPYSIARGINSLGISLLGLISLIIWATFTSIIAYEIEDSATVIIDTSPSFTPYIVIASVYVAIKVIDLAVLFGYKEQFKTLRKEQSYEARKGYRERVKYESRKPKDEAELRELIFGAIKELGEKASFTQIKLFIKRKGKLLITRTGVKLDIRYLESLILQFYISKSDNNIFMLEPEAEEYLQQREQLKEVQRQKEMEKEATRQTQLLLNNAPELIFCSTCEQYQIFDNGRCPMCGQ